MIQTIQTFLSDQADPYYNLAVEQYLLETVEENCCILYLWQNSNTVVIGRNQNAWKECRTTLLEQEGGHLARRLSGGGAVFHDLGNLNFTFLVPTADYDVERQLSVICTACRELGIPAEISGRNDVVVEGRKFSGNAFYQNGGRAYHHGTLLIHVDTEKMGRYLSPSKAKLEAKGVESVRSRVVNLREYRPGLTCRQMEQQLIAAFESVYGLSAEPLSPDCLDQTYIDGLRRRNGSREWLYGPKLLLRGTVPLGRHFAPAPGGVRPGPAGPGLLRRHGLDCGPPAGAGFARLSLLSGRFAKLHPHETEPARYPGRPVPDAGRTGDLI